VDNRGPGGFNDGQINALQRIAPYLALAIKSVSLARMTGTLMETYLGRDAGQRRWSLEMGVHCHHGLPARSLGSLPGYRSYSSRSLRSKASATKRQRPARPPDPHMFSPSRFPPPLEIFGRRPSACVAVPQRPASENLHNLGRSTPSARIRFTPRPVDMMHDGECRIGLAARGRMDVDQFFKVPAPHDEPFQ
jgi:hypothetical protein